MTSQWLWVRAVEDYADFFQGDQAAADHLVELGQDLFDALAGFDDFNDDGEILREPKHFVGVAAPVAAQAADAAQDGGTAEFFAAQQLDDGFIERLAVPAVGFTDVDAHQGALALEPFVLGRVGHGGSFRTRKFVRRCACRKSRRSARRSGWRARRSCRCAIGRPAASARFPSNMSRTW